MTFQRVLIANRGEIAIRIARACREAGLESIAVFSDVDRNAPHVRAADRAVHIGPAQASESYLSIDAIMEAARSTAAEAIHPGYGFLSENAEFAEMCERCGIKFIGPTSTTQATIRSRSSCECMRQASASSVPAHFGEIGPPDSR